jgi:hypothetical protein
VNNFGDRRHNLEIAARIFIPFILWNFEVMAPVPEIPEPRRLLPHTEIGDIAEKAKDVHKP